MDDDLIADRDAFEASGPEEDDAYGADRIGLRRAIAIIVLVVIVIGAFAGVAVLGGSDPEKTPRQLAQGGDLGSISDPMVLSEQLAPELTPEAEAGAEPVDRPACADSDQALPEDGASLIYSARLTWEGTPAVVLGYRVKGDNLQRLLLVMAETDCRILVTQSF